MIINKYTVWTDPSHAWIEVPKREVKELGLLDRISTFSFEKGDNLYLEEDVDGAMFLDRINEDIFELDERYEDESRVRKYKPYKGGLQ